MYELQRHLPIWLAARGRVLVTGLGLGCVVRGLLALPHVKHVDIVEIDDGILKHVGPEFRGNPRCTLHHADAMAIEWDAGTRWDFAWHDLRCDGAPLAHLHIDCLERYRSRVGRQGAWMLPRFASRLLKLWHPLLGAPRRAGMLT